MMQKSSDPKRYSRRRSRLANRHHLGAAAEDDEKEAWAPPCVRTDQFGRQVAIANVRQSWRNVSRTWPADHDRPT